MAILKDFIFLLLILSTLQETTTASRKNAKGQHKKNKRLNVLLLIADDMRPEIPTYNDKEKRPWLNSNVKTPNLDALASRSLVLKQAFVQIAKCNPSRTSFLTGRRPDTTHVHNNVQAFRQMGPANVITLPQYFKQSGFDTVGVGKVFHVRDSDFDLADLEHSWCQDSMYNPNDQYDHPHTAAWMAIPEEERKEKPLRDELILDEGLKVLQEKGEAYKEDGKPFFLAFGLHRPHLPFACPQEFYDMYPLDQIPKPPNNFCPYKMAKEAWYSSEELLDYPDMEQYLGDWKMNSTISPTMARELRRGYYSCMSYADHNFGQMLNKLDELDIRDNTVVVFLGDHGWHLEENAIWGKCTNFEVATHVPLMISIPGLTDEGQASDKLVELVDLYPSLAEAAGLDKPPLCPGQDSDRVPFCSEGSSWMPLIKDPDTDHWKSQVFSQYPVPDFNWLDRPDYMGYSMRTSRFRYNEWVNYTRGFPTSWSAPVAVELYDLDKDPRQTINLADDPEYADDLHDLSEQLHKGWKGALPDA